MALTLKAWNRLFLVDRDGFGRDLVVCRMAGHLGFLFALGLMGGHAVVRGSGISGIADDQGRTTNNQLDVGRHATTVICIQYGLIDCRLAPNIGLERSCQLLAFSSQ
jgi:hypothetical protein